MLARTIEHPLRWRDEALETHEEVLAHLDHFRDVRHRRQWKHRRYGPAFTGRDRRRRLGLRCCRRSLLRRLRGLYRFRLARQRLRLCSEREPTHARWAVGDLDDVERALRD